MKKITLFFMLFGAVTFGIVGCGNDTKSETEQGDAHNHEETKHEEGDGHNHSANDTTHNYNRKNEKYTFLKPNV